MHRRYASVPFVALLLGLSLWASRWPTPSSAQVGAPMAATERAVFLAGGLSGDDLLMLTTAVAASGHKGVVLVDVPKHHNATKAFLTAFRPEQVIPVGSFPDGGGELERRLGVKTAPALAWKRGPPAAVWELLFPRAERVVFAPPSCVGCCSRPPVSRERSKPLCSSFRASRRRPPTCNAGSANGGPPRSSPSPMPTGSVEIDRASGLPR